MIYFMIVFILYSLNINTAPTGFEPVIYSLEGFSGTTCPVALSRLGYGAMSVFL